MARIVLTEEGRARIAEAVQRAERGHRGEIVVHVEPRCFGDPLKRAAKLFVKLGVDRTAQGTGALLYIASAPRAAAVWAGAGIAGGDQLATWAPVFDALVAGAADPAVAIARAVEALGRVLAERAPGRDAHGNELTDEVRP